VRAWLDDEHVKSRTLDQRTVTFLRSRTIVAALLTIAAPVAVHAQAANLAQRPALSVSVGAFQYDLSGTGTAPLVAGRVELPLSRFFLVEGGLAVARPEQQFFDGGTYQISGAPIGTTTTYLIPELQLQVQAPLVAGRVAPYLGLGAGIADDRRPSRYGGSQSTMTVSGATGLRYWLSDRMGLRGELRVRGIGTSFAGAAAEYTLGTAWRF